MNAAGQFSHWRAICRDSHPLLSSHEYLLTAPRKVGIFAGLAGLQEVPHDQSITCITCG
jgi:hypothetical protein